MKKTISLIKVSLNHDMNIFKINSKRQNKISKVLLPLALTGYLMFIASIYSEMLFESLQTIHLEYAVLSIFGLIVSFISLLEGVYKSGPLLFNCKDDNMILALPIKKRTILFTRLFKFYIFELLYNSLFLLPSMIIYAIHMSPSWTFYLSSIIALLMLPILPIILSCIIGSIISYVSSKFKKKNVLLSIISVILTLSIMFLSFKTQNFADSMLQKANSLNALITHLYYPVGAYISLVNNFNFLNLIMYMLVHIIITLVLIFILGKCYFKINSSLKKEVTNHKKNSKLTIKKRKTMFAFIHKELNKFTTTPVFLTNAGFGLILFIIACVLSALKFDSIVIDMIKDNKEISLDMIKSFLPLLTFALVVFTSFMTSITSSMISLEGKSFMILKSLPLKPFKIIIYKVITALTIIIPCLLIGDFIVFIKFNFTVLDMFLILIASIILPAFTQMIGIIINLKYPKMDATNDTEVVKQSMSSAISVFLGMGLLLLTGGGMFVLFSTGIEPKLIMSIVIIIYSILNILLWNYLKKNSTKYFNEITV